MKGYSAFPKAPAFLEPHHQIVYDNRWWVSYLSAEKQSMFSTVPADRAKKMGWNIYIRDILYIREIYSNIPKYNFFLNYSNEYEHCIGWNWFIINIFFNFSEIFVLRLFKMAANEIVLQAWTEVCHQSFYWLRSTNHVKFTKECLMCTEKHVLVKKYLQMSYTWVYKTSLCQKDRHERTHNYWFSWKSCNYKYCFLQLIPQAKFPLFIEWPSYVSPNKIEII